MRPCWGAGAREVSPDVLIPVFFAMLAGVFNPKIGFGTAAVLIVLELLVRHA